MEITRVTIDQQQTGSISIAYFNSELPYCRPLHARTTRSRWGSNVFSRMAIASFLAMVLQWRTAGSAIVVAWFTPTVGKLEQHRKYPLIC